MRTRQRLTGLKNWVQSELCQGREMKAPSPDMDVTQILRKEPKCYLAWTPSRPDKTGFLEDDLFNACPGIIIMPRTAHAKYVEEKRFDRYNNVHRSQDLGQNLSVDILFTVYEPGTRLPGFADSATENSGPDIGLLMEGTEEGLFTLTDWMDECLEKLMAVKCIPGTDLFLNETTLAYGLYTDQSYVVDKRPLYYGFITVDFGGYAQEGVNPSINDYLK